MTGEPEELTLTTADGMRFGALAWGETSHSLALCLHGYPDTAWTWRHLGPRLAADGWRVVAPFMRGYAPSDLAVDNDYSIGAIAADAVALHAALGGDATAALVGHDWGALAAYTATAVAPDRFGRVVTLAVPPLRSALGGLRSPATALAELPLVLAQLRRSWYMFFQQVPALSERSLTALIPRLWKAWSPGYDATEDLGHLWAALSQPVCRTAALRYYRALMQPWYRSGRYASEQRRVMSVPSQPTLYLHGRDDGCIGSVFAERARPLLAAGSDVRVLDGAGHFLQLEQPDLVGELVAAFLATAR